MEEQRIKAMVELRVEEELRKRTESLEAEVVRRLAEARQTMEVEIRKEMEELLTISQSHKEQPDVEKVIILFITLSYI